MLNLARGGTVFMFLGTEECGNGVIKKKWNLVLLGGGRVGGGHLSACGEMGNLEECQKGIQAFRSN